jgi:Flp pilus assembly protein TadD
MQNLINKKLWFFLSPLLIIVAVISVFYGVLKHEFIGDDHIVVENNPFYSSWENLPLLLSSQYLTREQDVYQQKMLSPSSGSVSYRPVLSLTYFIDHDLWGKDASGYHLTNLVLHLVNSVLVYLFVYVIGGGIAGAFWTAFVFSIHPVVVEPVSSVGYRADLVATFFAMLCLLLFVLGNRSTSAFRFNFFMFLAVVAFFMGIFAKESVVILPLITITAEILFPPRYKKRWDVNLVLWSVVVFYFFIYVFVRFNAPTTNAALMGGNPVTHFFAAASIVGIYLRDIFFPFFGKLLLPLSHPAFNKTTVFMFVTAVFGLSVIIILLKKYWRPNPLIAFFLIWFLTGLLPVLNLIPLANPMAHRFLYFPLIGLIAAIMMYIQKLASEKIMIYLNAAGGIIAVILAVQSFQWMNIWKDDRTLAEYWEENYPSFWKAHAIGGEIKFQKGESTAAWEALTKSEALGAPDPRVYFLLGIMSTDAVSAERYFAKAVSMDPDYVSARIGLGRLYLMIGEKEEAVKHLKTAFEKKITYADASYLMQAYLLSDRIDEAEAVLTLALEDIKDVDQCNSLKRMFAEVPIHGQPIDIGM